MRAAEMATGNNADDLLPRETGRLLRRTAAGWVEVVADRLDRPVSVDNGPDRKPSISGPAFVVDRGEGTIVRLE